MGFGVLVVATTDFGTDYSVGTPEYAQTLAIGNEIVEALKTYHADCGHYPSELKELVPKYLNELKQPTWGAKAWYYLPQGIEGNPFYLEALVVMKDHRLGPHYSHGSWRYETN